MGLGQHGDGSTGVGSMGIGVAWGVGQREDEGRRAWGVLAMSRTMEGHAYKQQVFSSWEAFLGWKQSEDTLRMPVSSSLNVMTIGRYVTIN